MNIKVINSHGKIVAQNQRLPRPYGFAFKLPRGTYSVVAVGDYPVTVKVANGKTVHVDLAAGCT
jgi:hypothetical protein